MKSKTWLQLANHNIIKGSGVLRQHVKLVDKYSTSSAFLRRLLASDFGAALRLADRPLVLTGGCDVSLLWSSSTPASTKPFCPSQVNGRSDAIGDATALEGLAERARWQLDAGKKA